MCIPLLLVIPAELRYTLQRLTHEHVRMKEKKKRALWCPHRWAEETTHCRPSWAADTRGVWPAMAAAKSSSSSSDWSFWRQTDNRAERICGFLRRVQVPLMVLQRWTQKLKKDSFANNLQKFPACDSEIVDFAERRRVCCVSNVATMSRELV